MVFGRFRRLALGAAAACSLWHVQAGAADPLAGRILFGHNSARAALGATPLSWDPALATGAAAWAQYLARGGWFGHSDRKGRPGIGENLWMGTRGAYSIDQMIGQWAAERRYFKRGIYPDNSITGNWLHVVHYTQMVWPTTTRVGCARASGRGRDYLVCRYAPKGNVDGRLLPASPRR